MSLLSYELYIARAGQMKRRPGISIITQLAVAAIVVLFSTASLMGQQLPPANQVTTNANLGFCALPSTTFNPWWVSGSPSLNGAVNPANSAAFDGSSFCNFYQWGQQMFLWVTSPAKTYGGSGRVFDSPIFYDVTPPSGPNSTRHLIPHTQPFEHNLALRATKVGPHGLPMLMTKKGQLLDVHPPALGPTKKPLLLSQAGAKVEAASVAVENGKLVAKDKAGKVLSNVKPLPMKQIGRALPVQRFLINGKLVLVDAAGNVVDTEEGQATSDVLMGQTGSLIYYISQVNDVWVYWHQTHPGVVPPNGNNPPPSNVSFPTSQTGIPNMPDCTAQSCALAIELKTSWIDVTGLPNLQNYITMKATVPVYNKTSSTQWSKTNSSTEKTLALIGVHVVGSTKGHPEMIWASFEAFGNTPDSQYQYINASCSGTFTSCSANPSCCTTVPQNTSGKWLFSASGSSGPFNYSHMSVASPPCPTGFSGICANPILGQPQPPPYTISASDTLRTAPFGMPSGDFTDPSQFGVNNALSNTQVITANNQLLAAMPQGDIRNNYYLLGAIWTVGGAPLCTKKSDGTLSCEPDCLTATSQSPTNQVGTCMLENSTMETYAQLEQSGVTPPGGFQSSCFDCHQAAVTSSNVTSTDTSHIYDATYPLGSAVPGMATAGKTTKKK
jgi:hypothetical protein